jgi:diadenosine tetraphosphate (Ap4A) HIT family hydrolase
LGYRGDGVPEVLLETIECFMVNKHGKVGGGGGLVHSTYRAVIVRNHANFYHIILFPMSDTFNNTNDTTPQLTEELMQMVKPIKY